MNIENYFKDSNYDDLYLIALEKMLTAQDFVVAIVPETFINSNFLEKKRLVSITILEENPFHDTECPVVILCFDGKEKRRKEIKVYKNDVFISSLEDIEQYRLHPQKNISIRFNSKEGWLALRAIDLTNTSNKIMFDFKDAFDYDWKNNIKISSRLYSLIDINLPHQKKELFIQHANKILEKLRTNTPDIILSPFKGNMKNATRRRRLDYKTARAILEIAYTKTTREQSEQYRFF